MRAFVLLIFSLSLQGCFNIATTGASAVYNHRSIEKSFGDQYATIKAYRALFNQNGMFRNCNITIATFNDELLIAGQVPQAWQKPKAESCVRTALPNMKRIYNFLEIMNPSSSLIKMSDTWLTTKVKSKLIANNEIDATQIKVVTENGTVYMMGTLPEKAANLATEIASQTDGVVAVIKMFSYIQIYKKPQQMVPTPEPAIG